MASGDLNEYLIQDLVRKAAPIDSFGVGTELSTSRDDPAMNGVYKLVALRISETLGDDGKPMTPDHNMISYKLKTSPGKRTYPGPKQIQRTIKNEKIVEDIIVLENEKETSPGLGAPLLRKILDNGSLVYEMPSIEEIQQYCSEQIKLLPDQFKDLDYVPKEYPVRFSQELNTMSQTLKPV
jgi:nicotinate phosphoribosyltransferase